MVHSAHTPREAVVHVFDGFDGSLAYFPRTGDLAQVSDAGRIALKAFEEGKGRRQIASDLHEHGGKSAALQGLRDLRELERYGLLDAEVVLGEPEQREVARQYAAHHPRNLMFLVTEKCNLKCLYCYEVKNGVHEAGENVAMGDARRIVDDYLQSTGARSPVTITFFGGEPLLNFPVIQGVVVYAKKAAAALGKEVVFSLTTNLTLLTDESAEFLAREKFSVMVSLDGNKEANDANRKTVGGKGTYDTVVAKLNLLMAKQRVHGARMPRLRATVTSRDIDLVDVESDLLKLGTGLVRVGGASYSEGDDCAGWEEADAATRERFRGILSGDRIPPMIQKSLSELAKELNRAHAHQGEQQLCGVCRNMKAVTPKGDIYPCHRYVGMEEYKLGNLAEGGVDPQRLSRYYEKVQAQYHTKCVSCWARHLCRGRCVWTLSDEDGTVRTPDDEGCRVIRSFSEAQLGLYAGLVARGRLERSPEARRPSTKRTPTKERSSAHG